MEDQLARDHLNATTSNVSQFHTDDAYCDIEIHVENSVFKCHRLILAAATPYFNVMFGGKKGSFASEVTLKDIVQPEIFGEILKFIYTGKISINYRNLYHLVCASDFFVLPSITKLCFQYAQENVAALLRNGLELFCYTRATGQKTFSEFIGQYVFLNFSFFSKTRVFVEISFEDLRDLLSNRIPPPATTTNTSQDDVYMYAIMRWIRHTERSPQNMKSHFDELFKMVNLAGLSLNCMDDLIRMSINDLIELRQNDTSNGGLQSRPHTIDSEMKEGVHVFLNAYSDDNKSTFFTSVFSLIRDQSGGATDGRWINSFQFDCANSHRFMRTVVLDGSVYCLSSSRAPQSVGVPQIFRKSSSVSLRSNSYLKHPPLILDHYDMCGRGKYIYVYDQHQFALIPSSPLNTSFDYEQLSRSIYLYDREVDIWLPLPPLVHKFAEACLTCDDQMVYLIGGRSSNKYVQGYDHRTPKWISLSSTEYEYENGACCTHREKIYVSGGYHSMEMYDPVAGKWQCLGEKNFGRPNHRMDSSCLHSDCLVTVGKELSFFSDIQLYNVAENKLKSLTSLYQSVMDSDLEYKNDLKVIDIVNYYRP